MTNAESFLPHREHFDLLVEGLSIEDRRVYNTTRHAREETAYRGRTFIIYRMTGRHQHVVLDQLTVRDFECDEELGASTAIRNSAGQEIEVRYSPTRLWNHPVFVHIPLHCKLRWSAVPSNINKGSLGFPLVIRTLSRFDLREKGVVYCETGVTYAKEFPEHVA